MASRSQDEYITGTEPANGERSGATPGSKQLPIGARIDSAADRCIIRLSVRREDVTVQKETFVAGVATVRRARVGDAERIGDTVRAERLRVDVDGDVSVVRNNDIARVREEREEAR